MADDLNVMFVVFVAIGFFLPTFSFGLTKSAFFFFFLLDFPIFSCVCKLVQIAQALVSSPYRGGPTEEMHEYIVFMS